MNRLVLLGMFALAGCGGDTSPADAGAPDASRDLDASVADAAIADDTHEAVQRFARAFCERSARCSEQLDYGVPWASVDVCADGMARLLTIVDVTTSCEVSDVAVERSELAACLEQVQGLDCSVLYGQGAAVESLERKLEACRGSLEAFHRVRLLPRRGVIAAADEACGPGIFCEAGSACIVESKEDGCGHCVAAPREGEPCLFVGEDEVPGCWGHAFCVEGHCRMNAPAEGEPCSVLGECGQGLDCVGFESREAPGQCERERLEGDTCDDEDDPQTSCGEWYLCREGRCVSKLSLGKLGSACFLINDCRGGFCEDGTCVERRALGAACTDIAPCQEPYACIEGACTEPPATCAGEAGDVCTGTYQCGLGLVCLTGSPARCVQQIGRNHQPCIEPEYCIEGQCVDGMCSLVRDGDPCEDGSDCESLVCTDGACGVSACR
jgi:hypothetical protein